MKRILFALVLTLSPLYAFAECSVTASDGTVLPLCSLANTFVFDGAQVQSISVTYRNKTYTQTFTYDAGEVSVISAWILQG